MAYGGLNPNHIKHDGDSYTIKEQEFYKLSSKEFDLFHATVGKTQSGVVYCAESQWEKAKEYYSDSNNFKYYCEIKSRNNKHDVDFVKYEQLMNFVKESKLSSSKKAERYPIADGSRRSNTIFYKESKDGVFISDKNIEFQVVDDKLLLAYTYNMGNDKKEELIAFEVPSEIGQYFIDYI